MQTRHYGITGRLARFSAQRKWVIIVLWVVLFVAGGVLASGIDGVVTSQGSFTNEPDSAIAADLITDRLRGEERAEEVVVVRSQSLTVDDPAYQEFLSELLLDIRALEGTVESATSYQESGDQSLVSTSGSTTIIPVVLAGTLDEAQENVGNLIDVVERANEIQGFEVATGGTASIEYITNQVSESDLQRGEVIGIPIALIVLVVVFGALVAAGVPIVLAFISIVISMGATFLVGQTFELNILVTNIIFLIGLAVGIDYALFIIARYREERGRGLDRIDAITTAGDTASKAVFFSGMVVVIALTGMLIVPSTIFNSLGIGAITVVLVSVLATLTLLPAMLSVLGDRINRGRLPVIRRFTSPDATDSSFWDRVSKAVMRRPMVSVVAVAALLIALALPYADIDLGLPGVSTLPETTTPRQAFTMLDEEFSGGLIQPVEIVISANDVAAPEIQDATDNLVARLAADAAYGQATIETNPAGNLTLVTVPLRADPLSEDAQHTVSALRSDQIPAIFGDSDAEVYVGGTTAEVEDFLDIIDTYTPIIFGAILGISFLLLTMAFRSIVVPAKAIVMNLLSVGAAYGLLVLVFQKGYGADLLGFREVEHIAAFLPLFLFTVLFGLSMDYHVFLLSRIKERFDMTGDNTESVAFGIRTTSRIITGAALIMVAVFTGFAMGDIVELQQVGFGLAVAIFLDATVVRSVLVPASMKLLGSANWYFPNWLEWLPRINIEGEHYVPVAGVSVTGDD